LVPVGASEMPEATSNLRRGLIRVTPAMKQEMDNHKKERSKQNSTDILNKISYRFQSLPFKLYHQLPSFLTANLLTYSKVCLVCIRDGV